MPKRQLLLLMTLVAGLISFVGFAASDPYWSKSDVLGLSLFSIFFVALAFVVLVRRGQEPVEGHRGLPRSYWVVFASFSGAFVIALLLSVLAMPLVGFKGFEYLLGPDSWWVMLVLAAILYPFVQRRLL